MLSARFKRTNLDVITVGYGEATVVSGQLTTSAGGPVAGAALCIEERLLGAGAEARDRVVLPRIGFATTDDAGHYAYRLPAGPNREAVFAYRHAGLWLTQDVRYLAHTKPTLRRAPRRVLSKGLVRFWGKLPGPYAGGRVVILQGTVPGATRWFNVRYATTDQNGRFRFSYRFRATFWPATFVFRAVAPRQAGYPWLEGHGRPVSVRVRGERGVASRVPAQPSSLMSLISTW